MSSRAVSRVGGGPEPVGRFSFDVGSDRWWWSDELFDIYGFAPGSVVPTTELVLSHVHPDDDNTLRSLRQNAGHCGCRGRARREGHPLQATR